MKKIKEINYKTLVFYQNVIKMPERINSYLIYGNYLLISLCPIKGDKEYDYYIKSGNRFFEKYYQKKGDVFCYDSTGVLVWQWPEKGISGMRLIDQGFIDEEKRSNNKNRENLIEKGYSEDEIIPKDYANPLFRPEGQVLLQHAGPSYALLVDIASGKELDRWETR